MRKVLAISGGVDSMLLFSLFADDKTAVVAHFDHGTRPSSQDDAKFVERIAKNHGLSFFLGHGRLGENVSEAEARTARYRFLYKVAEEVNGEIYTAHHLNDLIETIAINFLRGTGWRGLAPFGNDNIRRPFLEKGYTKKDILKMAAEKNIVFRQDPTNVSDNYLRNRVRERSSELSEEVLKSLYDQYQKQVVIRATIENEITNLLSKDGRYNRKWLSKMHSEVALEILRAALKKVGVNATRPQMQDFLAAITSYLPEKKYNLPGGKMVTMHKHDFILK